MAEGSGSPVLDPIDFARGDATGVTMPLHPEALLRAGPEFLTEAFRAYGVLRTDNAVTRIDRAEPCLAGNSGEKLAIDVAYLKDVPGLATSLFVKFSRYFPDRFRDRRRHELEPEVRLAALSRLAEFPVTVARPCFADFEQGGGNGVLITEQIRFGQDGIDPPRAKCMDHLLDDAVDHYRATVTALARLAAAHQSGRLSPQVEELFPFDRAVAEADLPIACAAPTLDAKLAAIRDFVTAYPHLFVPQVSDPAFLERLLRDAPRFQEHDRQVRRFLFGDARMIALTHWNTNIDNAWFWRDEDGALQCGLLDWGMVRTTNVTYGIWGGLSASDPAMLETHLEALLALYASELRTGGGADVSPGELALHFDLAVALIGLSMMLDCPALVSGRIPDLAEARDRHDPRICRDQVARGFLHVFANWLDVWARRDFGSSLERMLRHTDGRETP